MYVTAYQYARDGMSDEQTAKSLGVSGNTLRRWCTKDKALVDALERGREVDSGGKTNTTFRDYVYRHLAPDLQKLWDEIDECAELENGVERVEALLHNGGKRARQHLFIHALTSSAFNVSASMHKMNMTRKTYDGWCANDPHFAELIDEMHFHKDNFFETAFMRRVQAGDTPAIIHAVKTKLRKRGYGEKIEVEHTGTVKHEHHIDVSTLGLPLATQRTILDAMRAQQAKLVEATVGTPTLTIAQ